MGTSLAFQRMPEEISTPALDNLNFRRRAFVLHYVLGDEGVRGVAYKSYIAAGYEAANNNVASAASYQLLRDASVIKAIEEVRTELEREFKNRMRSWPELAVKAQVALDRAVSTIVDPNFEPKCHLSANQLIAIREILDRALGRPKQTVEHEVGEKLDDLIKKLATGTAPAPQLPPGDPHYIGEARVIEHTPRPLLVDSDSSAD